MVKKNWYLDSFSFSECSRFSLSFYLPTKLSPTLHCLHADNVAKYSNSNLNILVSVMITCESWCHHDNKWLCILRLLTVLDRWYGRPDSMCLQPERLTGQTRQHAAATGKTNTVVHIAWQAVEKCTKNKWFPNPKKCDLCIVKMTLDTNNEIYTDYQRFSLSRLKNTPLVWGCGLKWRTRNQAGG